MFVYCDSTEVDVATGSNELAAVIAILFSL